VLDVPDAYRPVAWYGIRMALMPFRLRPVPVAASEADVDGSGIWYACPGDTAVGAVVPGNGWFRVVAPAGTAGTFLERRPLRAADVPFEGDIPVLFPCEGDISFDPIASVAYLLGLWHETMTTARDEHGRIQDHDMFSAQLGVSDRPIADQIRLAFGSLLARHGLEMERRTFGDGSWAFCSTHDIDYDRKWRKGIFYREIVERGLLGKSTDVHRSGGWRIRGRWQHVMGAVRGAGQAVRGDDPFRQATVRMREEVVARGGRGTFFFKAGAHGFRDVAYSLRSTFMQNQLRALRRDGFGIGLHPSYFAWDRPDWLHTEREKLGAAAGLPMDSVRMHYLRWSHPLTPRMLAEEGFRIDSTVGFSASAGFRAGTCLPFALFDTVSMEEMGMWEVPLIAMESAMFNRMGATGAAAVDVTRHLMRTCEEMGGVFTGLWHNTLWDEDDFPEWGYHFTWSLDRALRRHAAMLRVDEIPGAWS